MEPGSQRIGGNSLDGAYAIRHYGFCRQFCAERGGHLHFAIRFWAFCCSLGLAASVAHAGTQEDCAQKQNRELQIRACTELIGSDQRTDWIVWAYLNRGVAYHVKGDFSRAISDQTEALRLTPNNVLAYTFRGGVYASKREYERAIADFSEAIRLKPDFAPPYLQRGMAYRLKGDTDRALRDLDEAIRLNAKDVPVYVERGEVYTSKREYDRAITDFSEAIRLKPDFSPPYSKRAMVYRLKGDTDRALRDLDDAIRLNAKDVPAYVLRGQVYASEREYDRAIADFSEAIRINSKHSGAHVLRGVAHSSKGDHDDAIADLEEAIRLNPSLALAHWARGVVHWSRGDYDRSIADCDEAIKLDPRSDFSYSARGTAYASKGDYARAITDHNEAIKLNPKLGGYYVFRGYAHLYNGNNSGAIADYTEAISLDPKGAPRSAGAHAGRGEAYRRNRDYDRALLDLNEAIKRNSDYLASYAYRGSVHEAKGDRAKAIEDYNKALSIHAKTQWERDRQTEARSRVAAIQAATSNREDRRVALVVGNASYRTVKTLPNPLNDAREVAAALLAAGFSEVVQQFDLGVREMQKALKAFEEKATGADWAVVYYAGHGIEVDGRNFLIPVDAALKNASDVEDETLPLDRVIARVAGAKKLQLVILDACRDNPFVPRMAQPGGVVRAVGTRGLGQIEPTHPNLLIAYSARHGEAALDGTGKNSPYAKALVKHLAQPGLELGIFFRRVRAEVLARDLVVSSDLSSMAL